MAKSDFVSEFIGEMKESIGGIHALSVVEIASGMSLGSFSDGTLDPELASAYNVEVVKAKLKVIKALELNESIDDILITLTTQYHLIKCNEKCTHMVYLVADKGKANLALLRGMVRKGMESIQDKL